jgi:hypothetical protein
MMRIAKDVLVQIRVNRRERARWAKAAAREDMTTAELVREAVRVRIATTARFMMETGDRSETASDIATVDDHDNVAATTVDAAYLPGSDAPPGNPR